MLPKFFYGTDVLFIETAFRSNLGKRNDLKIFKTALHDVVCKFEVSSFRACWVYSFMAKLGLLARI